jgi:hypothetical protein
MPIVKPNYDKASTASTYLVPGRYVLKVVEAKESEHLDRNGHNALVIKFETTQNPNPAMNGKKVSRWLALGGPGSKVLYYFMRCIIPTYKGEPFDTSAIVGKHLEADVILETNPKDGKQWAKLDKMYPYIAKNSVDAKSVLHAIESDVPDFDDFDTN